MIVLVGSDDEQCIVLGNAVLREPHKKLAERLVESLEPGDKAGFTGPKGFFNRGADTGKRLTLIVVRVFNVTVDHRDARFEHRRQVAQGLRR